MAVRHGYGKIAGADALVFAYDTGDTRNSYKGEPTTNFISNPTEEMPRGEFGQYRDLAPTFETYGLVPYSLSMDIKTNIPGNVYVYMQNGSTSRHGFVGANASATTEYQRFYFENLTPTLNDPGTAASTLATYTGYGSGVNPTVRNIQLELGAHSTQFTAGTRSATEGLKDLTGNSSIDLSNVSFGSDAQMEFDGTDDRIDIPTNFGTLDAYTFEYVAYANSTHNMPISSRTSTAFYKYGAYSWRYTHGGVAAEFYHTSGNGTGWAYYAVTYDGSTITVWENGVSKGTRASTGTADFSGGIKIGSWASAASYTWDGTIPVMKMYNRALTAGEVKNNFNHYKNRFGI